MKKQFPFEKVCNKIDELSLRLERWERDDNSRGNFHNQALVERIEKLEAEVDIHYPLTLEN